MQKKQIIPGILLCGVAALLLPAFRQAQDPNVVLCASYMSSDILALNLYTEDYDETLPSWTNNADLYTKLYPYLANQANTFVCPATDQQFQFNIALKGITQASLNSRSTTEYLRDSVPHPDGLISIGYGSGHVYHGGVFVGDTVKLCVENAKSYALGIKEYIQDYDEMLPIMSSQARINDEIYPYVRDSSVFYCPITLKPYQLNTGLSGKSLGLYPNPSEVWLLMDPIPHPVDGHRTVAYLDWHVVRPGYPTATERTAQCIDNEHQIVLGVMLYSQDYDGFLPYLSNSQQTVTVLTPYVKNSNIFICPQTGLHYLYNSRLSGQSLASITQPAYTWVLTDAATHPDGKKTTAYLNGSVVHPGYAAPGISGAPYANNQDCLKSVKMDSLATLMYVQDYDETLPPMYSPAQYDNLLLPYLQNKSTIACPITFTLYLPTASLSGIPLAMIEAPASTVVLQDYRKHPDRSFTYGYADGHAHGQPPQ